MVRGTSPHLRVAALVWAANPDLTNEDVRDILQTTAEPLDGLDGREQGYGLVRADLAVASVMQPPPLTVTVYPVDFGSVIPGSTRILESTAIVTVEGPKISELKASASEIEGGETSWVWGDGADPDTVKMEITITDGPRADDSVAITEGQKEYQFFTSENVQAGSYSADVTLTVGPRLNADLDEPMATVVTYTVTVY